MKTLITDIKAAILYLTYFQVYEGDNPGEQKTLQLEIISNNLIDLGYPDPRTIPFDDDGCPNITWASNDHEHTSDFSLSKDFSCIEFYESIEFNPNFFNN